MGESVHLNTGSDTGTEVAAARMFNILRLIGCVSEWRSLAKAQYHIIMVKLSPVLALA